MFHWLTLSEREQKDLETAIKELGYSYTPKFTSPHFIY